MGQATNCFAQSADSIGKRIEPLISEPHRAELLPDLFDGIHFGGIRRNRQQSDRIRTDEGFRSVPSCAVTDRKNSVYVILLKKRILVLNISLINQMNKRRLEYYLKSLALFYPLLSDSMYFFYFLVNKR